jgi:hypothetical protein
MILGGVNMGHTTSIILMLCALCLLGYNNSNKGDSVGNDLYNHICVVARVVVVVGHRLQRPVWGYTQETWPNCKATTPYKQ